MAWTRPLDIDVAALTAWLMPVEPQSAIRHQVVVFVWDDAGNHVLRMADSTFGWLAEVERAGGRNWARIRTMMGEAVAQAYSDQRSKTCDLSVLGIRTVKDGRRVTRANPDRLVRVVTGIADLVTQMATLLDGRNLTDEQVLPLVQRYGELRDEMRELRAAMDGADGNFEVAQAYLVKMMEAAE